MDAYYAIASLRTVREYSDRPISREGLERILQAGRAAGSSQNTQPWQFLIIRTREKLEQIATAVFAPDNLIGCRAAIAVATTGKGGFDLGRCAQNMMLAAWSDRIGSAPNGVRDAAAMATILDLSPQQSVATVLSFGYPVKPARTSGDVQGILARIKRKPLEELAVWIE